MLEEKCDDMCPTRVMFPKANLGPLSANSDIRNVGASPAACQLSHHSGKVAAHSQAEPTEREHMVESPLRIGTFWRTPRLLRNSSRCATAVALLAEQLSGLQVRGAGQY
jgi:hypothetical protein